MMGELNIQSIALACPLPYSFVQSSYISSFFFLSEYDDCRGNVQLAVLVGDVSSGVPPSSPSDRYFHPFFFFFLFFFSPLVSRPTFRHSLLPNIKSNLATVVAYSSYTSCFVPFFSSSFFSSSFLSSERTTTI